ncbi:MAG: ribonuclease III [Anaplasmataceae bacterium]|nr:ribonuclease III [Anaplasmataceae bacterium]
MSITTLERKINYIFHDKEILIEALTHSSIDASKNYQRLEFLGDNILGMTIGHILFLKFPERTEGELAFMHMELVKSDSIVVIAEKLELSRHIILSKNENANQIRTSKKVLEDITEALIGAIYLDSLHQQGFGFAFDNIITFLKEFHEKIESIQFMEKDSKTKLQELMQSQGLPIPNYTIVSQTGSDHEPVFEIELNISAYTAIGYGKNKKQAQQDAAEKMLEILEDEEVHE